MLPDCVYKEEVFMAVKNLDNFYKEVESNKLIGETYNKYTFPMQLEFLEHRLKTELEGNAVKNGYLVIDRCIFEDYHMFGKTAHSLGKLKRLHD